MKGSKVIYLVTSNILYMGENYYRGYFLFGFTKHLSPLYPCTKCNPQWSGVYQAVICKFRKGPPTILPSAPPVPWKQLTDRVVNVHDSVTCFFLNCGFLL